MESVIRARVRGKGISFFNRLRREGVKAKITRNSTIIVELPVTAGLIEPGPFYYGVPRLLKNGTDVLFLIEVGEETASWDHRQARIVCGLSGKRIRPYYTPRKGKVSAMFSVPRAVVTITAYKEGDFTVLGNYIMKTRGDNLYINQKILYHGMSLPMEMAHFEEAAEAARIKSGRSDHRRVCYAL